MVAPLIVAGARVAGSRMLGRTAAREATKYATPSNLSRAGSLPRTQMKLNGPIPKPIMPSGLFHLMIGCAVLFDFCQIIIAALFFSPHISLPLLNSALGASICNAVLNLGDTICGALASGTGVGLRLATGVLDVTTAGGLTMFSQGMGQLLSTFVGFAGIVFFGFWFLFSGVSFFKGPRALKRFGGYGFQAIAESIPFLGTLPSLTVSVAYICIQARREDKEAAVAAAAQMQQQNTMMVRAEAIRRAREQNAAQQNLAEEEALRAQTQEAEDREAEEKALPAHIQEAMNRPLESTEESDEYRAVA